jgi:hypothetical protein
VFVEGLAFAPERNINPLIPISDAGLGNPPDVLPHNLVVTDWLVLAARKVNQDHGASSTNLGTIGLAEIKKQYDTHQTKTR